jgi:phospholipid/cholesterol/gamma-HCH transport system substrate-binding protein
MAQGSSKALTWTELRVGVVVVVSLVVLAFTVLYIGGSGGSPFAKSYTLKAQMTDVNGLKKGAPVRVGGVEVGTVKDVAFTQDASGLVEVKMAVDGRMRDRITTESRATLGNLGLLGEKAVDITAGPGGTPIGDNGYVRADSADPFKGLLADASESTAHLKRILARMDAGEGLIGKALRDEELYDRMVDVSVRLQQVMGKLESTQGPLGRLVNDSQMSASLARSAQGLEAVMTRIERGEGALGVLSKDDKLVADIRGITTGLNDVASRLQKGEGSLGKMMTDETLYQRLDSMAQQFERLATRMESGEGSMGKLMRDPEFYNNLNGAARDLRNLIEEVKKDPQKYLRLKLSVF